MTRVLVPLAQGCEELEAVTIIDLLRRAGIEVVTAGLDDGPVTASRGVRLLADVPLDEVLGQEFDMIVLPGGLPGSDHLDADERVQGLLKRLSEEGKVTAAICAAPKALATAGLLDGRKATSYPGVIDAMGLSSTKVLEEAVVEDGTVITSRGPGTAMDFSLALIERLLGRDARDSVEGPLMRPTH